jgi:Mrp family chromosome partitioning ATPase
LDALQLLRANLELSQTGTSGPTILVTSAAIGDGKTTVAAHLGASLALARKEVICVDADLRRPALHRYFGLDPAAAGLTELLAGEIDVDEALRPVRLVDPRLDENSRVAARSSISDSAAAMSNPLSSSGNLHVVTAGRADPNPDALLTPDRVAELVALLRSKAPYVIFDAAPLQLADSFPLVLSSDTVLAIVRLGRTTREEAEEVRSLLDGLGARNVSIVLTDAPRDDGYGYRYG